MEVVVYLQLQSLLKSRPAESDIDIELERTWRHLDLTWRWSGPEFDNYVKDADILLTLSVICLLKNMKITAWQEKHFLVTIQDIIPGW